MILDGGQRDVADPVDTGRLQAFSDGVFAVAITLLVFDLNVAGQSGSLAHRLGAQWPSYAAFLISFAMIGIMWINHHQMFRDIRAADHGLIVVNLALLLVVTAFPFPTKVVAEARVDTRTRMVFLGLPTFGVATLVALVSPEASVALDGALALVYLLPGDRLERLLAPEQRSAIRTSGDTDPTGPG